MLRAPTKASIPSLALEKYKVTLAGILKVTEIWEPALKELAACQGQNPSNIMELRGQ